MPAKHLMTVTALWWLSACNGPPTINSATSTTVAGQHNTLTNHHGGIVAVGAGLEIETVSKDRGRLELYVTGPQGPINDANIALTLRDADGKTTALSIAYSPRSLAYVGYVTHVVPGNYDAEVVVTTAQQRTQTLSMRMLISTTVTVPPARYGGSVELVGEFAIEIVPNPSGDVAFFIMDIDGNLIPPDEVSMPMVAFLDPEASSRSGNRPGPGPSPGQGPTLTANSMPTANAILANSTPGAVLQPNTIHTQTLEPVINAAGSLAATQPLAMTTSTITVERDGDHYVARGVANPSNNTRPVALDMTLQIRGQQLRVRPAAVSFASATRLVATNTQRTPRLATNLAPNGSPANSARTTNEPLRVTAATPPSIARTETPSQAQVPVPVQAPANNSDNPNMQPSAVSPTIMAQLQQPEPTQPTVVTPALPPPTVQHPQLPPAVAVRSPVPTAVPMQQPVQQPVQQQPGIVIVPPSGVPLPPVRINVNGLLQR